MGRSKEAQFVRAESKQQPERHNRSFLADAEQELIRWLLPRIPANVTSLNLTAVGMIGSASAAIGLVGCNWSDWFLPLVVFGVILMAFMIFLPKGLVPTIAAKFGRSQ